MRLAGVVRNMMPFIPVIFGTKEMPMCFRGHWRGTAVIRHHRIRGEVSHMNIRYNTHAPEDAVRRCMEKISQARDEDLRF